eukprot:COSAG01_NODE_33243_length_567_cov_1.826923_2_plen_89_part_00
MPPPPRRSDSTACPRSTTLLLRRCTLLLLAILAEAHLVLAPCGALHDDYNGNALLAAGVVSEPIFYRKPVWMRSTCKRTLNRRNHREI